MHKILMAISLALVGAASVQLPAASGGDGHCNCCGCNAPCQKVCRLVKEEKKVEIVCWGCKCEDFCIPAPSTPLCKHCEMVCGEEDVGGGKGAPCVQPKPFVWMEWLPGCGAQIHTKKKLMKKVVTKKILSFKWVVEDLCPQCEQKVAAAEFEPDHAIPLPPPVDAKILVGNRASIGDLPR
jgi:hypothetical protein